MINRTIEPSSGRILLDGEDIAQQDAALLRRKMGYVIQHAGLFPHRTVADNIATVPLLNGVNKKQARERAVELLDRVGLDQSLATRYPAQLSGGQQQRVGVARALAADPPVMLMDEPFSAVDPIVRDGLQKESCGSRPSWARPSPSSPTTSTRRSSSGTTWRSSGKVATWPRWVPRRSSSTTPPTSSSPTSSVATGASVGFPS